MDFINIYGNTIPRVSLQFLSVQALKCYKCIKEGCGHPFDAANSGVSQVECGGVCMTRTMTGFTSKQIEEMSPFKVGGRFKLIVLFEDKKVAASREKQHFAPF